MNEYITTGSFNLGNQITLKNVNSNVDRDYGPYEDKTLTEIADLLKDTIQIGKTVGVIEEGKIVEYWWQKEGEIFKFVLKQNSGVVDITDDAIRALFCIPAKDPANNEIWYTSTDGSVVTPYSTDAFGAKITSNTYENGKGVITFDGDVTSVGNNAFYGCSKLTSIEIPSSVTSIGIYAFWDCTGLKYITIPNSVTSIGPGAFHYCSALTSITIPNSVRSIGYGAFDRCSSLTSITIPNSVRSIGWGVFNRCSNMTSITIPNSVTMIGAYAFYQCSSLNSITIPNSVTMIGEYAFYQCSSLNSITIPNSVTMIGDRAFHSCTNLKNIKYNGYRKDWYEIQLGNNWNENIPCKIVQCLDGDLYLNEYFDTIGVFDDIK